jgi:hypothetical protein
LKIEEGSLDGDDVWLKVNDQSRHGIDGALQCSLRRLPFGDDFDRVVDELSVVEESNPHEVGAWIDGENSPV